MNKKDFQEAWKSDWHRQKSEGEGLGGLFQRFVRGADQAWVDRWEKLMYETAGFAYETATELHRAENDEKKAEQLKSKLSTMTQNIYSSVIVPDDKPNKADDTNNPDSEGGE